MLLDIRLLALSYQVLLNNRLLLKNYWLAKEKCCWTTTHFPFRFSSTPVHLVFSHDAGSPLYVLISSRMQKNQATLPSRENVIRKSFNSWRTYLKSGLIQKGTFCFTSSNFFTTREFDNSGDLKLIENL